MSNVFFASDYHFSHKNILTFKKEDGSPLRVFNDVNHMNEYMVMQHNRVVGPKDKVYMLGDIGLTKSGAGFEILSRMNGEKILIKGNHDVATLDTYAKYFKDIRGSHGLDGMILTHIPIHPDSLCRWKANIHGHLHSNRVSVPDIFGKPMLDPRYYNVSMECLQDYTPISYEDAKKDINYALEHSA